RRGDHWSRPGPADRSRGWPRPVRGDVPPLLAARDARGGTGEPVAVTAERAAGPALSPEAGGLLDDPVRRRVHRPVRPPEGIPDRGEEGRGRRPSRRAPVP